MTGAPAEEEIDEPTGKFLRPGSDIAYFKLLAYLSRANWISTAIVRQLAKFDRGGDGLPAEPAMVSGLSERDCSHWVPHSNERAASQNLMNNEDENPSRTSFQTKLKISPFWVWNLERSSGHLEK
jgi:hypothetical protein